MLTTLLPQLGVTVGSHCLVQTQEAERLFRLERICEKMQRYGMGPGGFWLKKELMHFMFFFRNRIWYRCTVKDRKCKMWNHEKMGKLNMLQVICVLFVIIVRVQGIYTETNILPLKMHGWKMACLQGLSKTKLREIHSFTWSQVGTVFYHVGSLWI